MPYELVAISPWYILPSIVETTDQSPWSRPLLFLNRNLGKHLCVALTKRQYIFSRLSVGIVSIVLHAFHWKIMII